MSSSTASMRKRKNRMPPDVFLSDAVAAADPRRWLDEHLRARTADCTAAGRRSVRCPRLNSRRFRLGRKKCSLIFQSQRADESQLPVGGSCGFMLTDGSHALSAGPSLFARPIIPTEGILSSRSAGGSCAAGEPAAAKRSDVVAVVLSMISGLTLCSAALCFFVSP